MEIQQLRHLIAAVKHRSFAKAAEETNITQPGLSRSIRALETRLGLPLLDRTAHGVEPTIFGVSVLRRAQVILNEVARAREELRALEASKVGDLTFGITQNFAHYFIPAILGRLHEEHPQVRYNVLSGGPLELLEMVRAATIDFAFGLFSTAVNAADLKVEYLRQHRSAIVCRAGHPLAGREGVTPADLAEAKWITVSSEGFQRSYRNFFLSRGFLPPMPSITTGSLPLIRRTILHADLLTVLPQDVVSDDVTEGRLMFVGSQGLAEYTSVGYVTRADGFITPQMRDALDLIRHEMSREMSEPDGG
jgi:DNA-binding transcriptional LysR family regulator